MLNEISAPSQSVHRPDGSATEDTPPGYGVYVIELSKNANRYLDVPVDLPLPCVYVGQSWHSPEVRLMNHREGGVTSSRIVYYNGKGLRPDLYGHLPRVDTQDEALRLEAHHARVLAGLGFHAYYDNHLIRPGRTEPPSECALMRTYEHIALTADETMDPHIFRAIALLADSRNRRATIRDVVGLLTTGDRTDHLRLPGSFEALGRFVYLNEGVVGSRLDYLAGIEVIQTDADGGIIIPTR